MADERTDPLTQPDPVNQALAQIGATDDDNTQEEAYPENDDKAEKPKFKAPEQRNSSGKIIHSGNNEENDDDDEEPAPAVLSTAKLVKAGIAVGILAIAATAAWTFMGPAKKTLPGQGMTEEERRTMYVQQSADMIPQGDIQDPPQNPVPFNNKDSKNPPTTNGAKKPPVETTRVSTIVVPNLERENVGIRKAVEELNRGNPSDITWLTNQALEPAILQALRTARGNGTNIVVVCGKNAIKENLQGVISSGIALQRSTRDLGKNTSVLIIAGRKVIDISNPEMVWITIEPSAIQHLANWYWSQHKDTLTVE